MICALPYACIGNHPPQPVETCSEPAGDRCVFWRHSLIPLVRAERQRSRQSPNQKRPRWRTFHSSICQQASRVMPSEEEIKAQQELLAAYRHTLAQYLKQRAMLSELLAPPGIAHGIQEARDHIRHVKKSLHSWGVAVEDHPNDEEAPSTQDVPTIRKVPASPRIGVYIGAVVLLISLGVVGLLIFKNIGIAPVSHAAAPTANPSTATPKALVPPTNTPTPTNTSVPPTNTPTPTNTSVPPTNTPTPTNTSVPPTNTPTPTNTPVPPLNPVIVGPSAVMAGSRLTVFARGPDGTLIHKFYDNGWTDWIPLGAGQISSSPSAVMAGSRLTVFARGPDGTLIHKFYDNGWTDWIPLGAGQIG